MTSWLCSPAMCEDANCEDWRRAWWEVVVERLYTDYHDTYIIVREALGFSPNTATRIIDLDSGVRLII